MMDSIDRVVSHLMKCGPNASAPTPAGKHQVESHLGSALGSGLPVMGLDSYAKCLVSSRINRRRNHMVRQKWIWQMQIIAKQQL